MINDTLQNRRYVISIIMSAVIVVYILRLFTIQIIDTKYKNRDIYTWIVEWWQYFQYSTES